jgi:hypothetical protein
LEQANVDLVGKLAQAKLKRETEPDVPVTRYDSENPMSQEQIEAEAIKFTHETPEYYGTQANFAALSEYMQHFSLAPIAANWKVAFHALDRQGLLTRATGPVQKHARALTVKDIEAMPADVYKRKLLEDPEFAAHVESLCQGK